MPRPSKKAAEDKSKAVPAPVPAPAPVAAAPPMPQPMMPAPMQTPPGMLPQGHHQAHPQMQPYQQSHNPMMQAGLAPGQMRVIDNESFLRVRDSVSQPFSSFFLHNRTSLLKGFTSARHLGTGCFEPEVDMARQSSSEESFDSYFMVVMMRHSSASSAIVA